MSAFFSSLLSGLAAILAAVSLVWLLSLVKRDVSIVDIFWGLGFVGLTWFYRTLGPEITARHWLLLRPGDDMGLPSRTLSAVA